MLTIIGYFIAGLAGMLVGAVANEVHRRLHPPVSTGCPHSWGMWENCKVGNGYRNGEPVAVPGQKRDCTMCGERQARTVTTH